MEFTLGFVTAILMMVALGWFLKTRADFYRNKLIEKANTCGEVCGDMSVCGCRHIGLDCKYDAFKRDELKEALLYEDDPF